MKWSNLSAHWTCLTWQDHVQQLNRPNTRRKYDAHFKNEVVKMLTNGQTAAYVSKALGISENLIYRWKNQNQGAKKVGCEQSELALENQQFRDRVRQLETEREILKKCLAGVPLSIFSPGGEPRQT